MTSKPPQRIGPYRIVEVLGQGGMGVVYRAEHLQSGEPAAVKTVRLPHEALLQSLRREIHALARLEHPGIVRILGEGVEDGVPWYAMELLEGTTLRSYCPAEAKKPGASRWWTTALETDPRHAASTFAAAAPEALRQAGLASTDWPGQRRGHEGQGAGTTMPAGAAEARRPAAGGLLPAVLSLMRSLCAPLAFLHGEGIVHRDLKPENVFIRPAGGPGAAPGSIGHLAAAPGSIGHPGAAPGSIGHPAAAPGSIGLPVLMDFGLMSRFAGSLSREVLEFSGFAAGTAAYTAPEQLLGELVDARADLYAFGCLLHELVTGRPPFLGATRAELHRKHLEAEPPRASDLALGVPPELDALILRLLAKRPQERLGHADDVARALAEMGAEEAASARGPKARTYLYRPGFVGRQDRMSEIERHLGRLEAGWGGLLLVDGESGVGKTRLAMEVVRQARRRGIGVLCGECLPTQNPEPLEALRAPLQAVADRCREHGEAETERLLGRRALVLAQYEPALAGLPGQDPAAAAEAQALASLPAAAARLRLFSALAETFEALAEGRESGGACLLLVLDDLQWADELTLGFLQYLLGTVAEGTQASSLLVAGTYRTEDVGAHRGVALQSLSQAPGVVRIHLRRLDEGSVGSMVGDMLALGQQPRPFVRFLARHSEGNPFFVAEYLRTALAEGLLYRDGAGRWQMAVADEASDAAYEELPLPRSVQDLVGRRIEGLQAGARQLAEIGAVLGREMDEDLLEGVARTESLELMEPLSECLTRQILEELSATRLRFVHDKIREVLYGRLGAGRRQQLHHAAAEGIEAKAGPQRDGLMAALGHHREQAGEPEKARSCYLAAARTARSRHAPDEAERLYRAYLRLAVVPTLESIEVRNELGHQILRDQGRMQEAIAEQELAVAEARRLGDAGAEGRSLHRLGILNGDVGDVGKGLELLEQSLSRLAEAKDTMGTAHALRSLSALHYQQGRPAESLEALEQAIAIYRQADAHAYEAIAMGNLSLVYVEQGRLEDARVLNERLFGIYAELGNRRSEAITRYNQGRIYIEQGRLEDARRLMEQSLAIIRELGIRQLEAQPLLGLASVAQEFGRPAEAAALYLQAIDVAREIRDRRIESLALVSRAILERRTGEPAAARQTLEESEPILQSLSDTPGRLVGLCERGHLEMGQGAPAAHLLALAQELAAQSNIHPATEQGKALTRLRRAVEAYEAQRPLFRGECVEDLPSGLRHWLIEAGQLVPDAGPPEAC